jgi:hypothetical protein
MLCQHEHSADANAHFRPEATGTGPNHLQGQIATEPASESRTSAHSGLPHPTPRDSAGARSRDLTIDRPHGMICVLHRGPAQDEKYLFPGHLIRRGAPLHHRTQGSESALRRCVALWDGVNHSPRASRDRRRCLIGGTLWGSPRFRRADPAGDRCESAARGHRAACPQG